VKKTNNKQTQHASDDATMRNSQGHRGETKQQHQTNNDTESDSQPTN